MSVGTCCRKRAKMATPRQPSMRPLHVRTRVPKREEERAAGLAAPLRSAATRPLAGTCGRGAAHPER
jgi:hypothetical protein